MRDSGAVSWMFTGQRDKQSSIQNAHSQGVGNWELKLSLLWFETCHRINVCLASLVAREVDRGDETFLVCLLWENFYPSGKLVTGDCGRGTTSRRALVAVKMWFPSTLIAIASRGIASGRIPVWFRIVECTRPKGAVRVNKLPWEVNRQKHSNNQWQLRDLTDTG